MARQTRMETAVVAAVAALIAALALTAPAARAESPVKGFKTATFKVEVKGWQKMVQQHTRAAVDECDYSDFSSGSEEVVFATTKPVYLTATYAPGFENPEFFSKTGQLEIPTKAKVKRSYTPRVHSPAVPCEDNGGGVETTYQPDCGTKTVQPYGVRLQYTRYRKDGLLLSGNGDDDPFERCPGAGTMGFPWLLTDTVRPGNYIYADLSQAELFDPEFRKWISIADGSRRSDETNYWTKTQIHWEVSFTRLREKVAR